MFVSVKGVEWNVYRRYTEFREFHRQLQKHVQEVSTFNFPPKKAIGNKVCAFYMEVALSSLFLFVELTSSRREKAKIAGISKICN